MIAKKTIPRWQRSTDRLEITIPSEARLKPVLFLSLWCLSWPFGFLLFPLVVLETIPLVYVAWPLAFLAFLAVAATWAKAMAKLLYWLFGAERITLDAQSLTLARGVGRFSLSRSYERSNIRQLRVSPRRHWVKDWHWPLHLRLPSGGALSFNYPRKAVRFGRNLTARQAGELLEMMQGFWGSDEGPEADR